MWMELHHLYIRWGTQKLIRYITVNFIYVKYSYVTTCKMSITSLSFKFFFKWRKCSSRGTLKIYILLSMKVCPKQNKVHSQCYLLPQYFECNFGMFFRWNCSECLIVMHKHVMNITQNCLSDFFCQNNLYNWQLFQNVRHKSRYINIEKIKLSKNVYSFYCFPSVYKSKHRITEWTNMQTFSKWHCESTEKKLFKDLQHGRQTMSA